MFTFYFKILYSLEFITSKIWNISLLAGTGEIDFWEGICFSRWRRRWIDIEFGEGCGM